MLATCGVVIAASTMTAQQAPVKLESVAAPGNAARIEAINKASVTGKKQPKNKIRGGYVYTFWGVTPNSVLEDQNVILSFEKAIVPHYNNFSLGHGYFPRIENKTDKSIYVDLANSFYIDGKGVSHPLFDTTAYTTTNSSSTGAGVNMGGIAGALGIGGAIGKIAGGIGVSSTSGTGTSVTEQQQPVVVVPAHSASQFAITRYVLGNNVIDAPLIMTYMMDRPYDTWSGDGYWEKQYKEILKDYADFSNSTISGEELDLQENAFVKFTPENSPKKIKFIFTYSTTPDFAEYYTIESDLYLKNIFGAGGRSNFIKDPGEAFESKHFVFNDDDAPIIWGYGWLPKSEKKNNDKSKAKGASME